MPAEQFFWMIILMGAAALIIFAIGLSGRSSRPKAVWGRLCSACGTYMPNFAKFCPHCGRRAEGQSQK